MSWSPSLLELRLIESIFRKEINPILKAIQPSSELFRKRIANYEKGLFLFFPGRIFSSASFDEPFKHHFAKKWEQATITGIHFLLACSPYVTGEKNVLHYPLFWASITNFDNVKVSYSALFIILLQFRRGHFARHSAGGDVRKIGRAHTSSLKAWIKLRFFFRKITFRYIYLKLCFCVMNKSANKNRPINLFHVKMNSNR